ncbi:MAG: alpha/beta hydrolase [bacterium]|nr:alpha/beta hydrolase [bacterium]
MKKHKIIIGTAAGLLTATAAAGIFFYRFAFIKPKKLEDMSKDMEPFREEIQRTRAWLDEQPLEEIGIKSIDGLHLNGYYLPVEDAARTVVCVNGFRGNGKKDFVLLSKYLHEHQCNVLLVDQRGCGLSDGEMCYGIMGRYDCISWLDYLTDRLGEDMPLYLHGGSMGAATVMMASELNLPSAMKGVIADCGYTTPWKEMKHAAKQLFHIPSFPMIYLLDVALMARQGFSLKDVSATEAVKHSKVPILFIHGDEDTFVPTEMSRTNYNACTAPKHLEIFEGAAHCMSYMTDTERYQRALQRFFDACENGDHSGFFSRI